MEQKILKLVFSEPEIAATHAIVEDTPEGLETGAAMFGARVDDQHVVLAVIGPGQQAVHTPTFHEPDADYLNQKLEQLKKFFPCLEWIGSYHVHPSGMAWLSRHDVRTVNRLFVGASGTFLPDFVAGIIQRRGKKLEIYPYLLTPNNLEPRLMLMAIVSEQSEIIRRARDCARGIIPPATTTEGVPVQIEIAGNDDATAAHSRLSVARLIQKFTRVRRFFGR